MFSAIPKLLPFLGVYLVIGLYVGRDLAIFCHYVPIATIAFLGLFVAAAIFPKAIAAGLRNVQIQMSAVGPGLSLAITAAMAVLFAFYVHRRIRPARGSDLN